MKTKEVYIKGWLINVYDDCVQISREKSARWSDENVGGLIFRKLDEIGVPTFSVTDDSISNERRWINSVFVRFYVSDKEMDWNDIVEQDVTEMAGGMKTEYAEYGYSEYTIIDTVTSIFVGKHNIIDELKPHIGKYLNLKITVKHI